MTYNVRESRRSEFVTFGIFMGERRILIANKATLKSFSYEFFDGGTTLRSSRDEN